MRAASLFAAVLCCAGAAHAADIPAGYPADYARLIAAAEKDRDLVIYGALDAASVQPLLKAFAKSFPRIAVDYRDLSANELQLRIKSDAQSGANVSDLVWSGAVALQARLIQDGFAASYASPEKPHLPPSASWRDQAYVVTYEPVVFAYNKTLLPDAPQTHDALLALLHDRKSALAGKVATYDVERNHVALSYVSNDELYYAKFWDLAAALNAAGAKRYTATGTLLERVGNGQLVLAYDVAGSAAVARSKRDAALGIVYPQDYTLAAGTVMFVTSSARHANAAKLFLDFALRQEGQAALTESSLFAVRADVPGETTITALRKQLGDRLKLIAIDDAAAQPPDPAARQAFLQKWQGDAATR